MKFTQTGTAKENALEKIVSINLLESVENILVERLDYFLGFATEEKPAVIEDYCTLLAKKFQGLVDGDELNTLPDEVQDIPKKFDQTAQYPELSRAALAYFLALLGISDTSGGEAEEIEVTMGALVRAWVFPPYYILEALAESIGRSEAVNLFKQYLTHYYIDHPSPNRDKFISLEKMVEERLSGDTTASDWVIVHTLLEDGKYAFKNKNCPTCVDSMVDLPDIEFKYMACCYADYEKFRSYYSEHIILTMEHTLMEGEPYCSRVLHDTRIDYDLRHPPKEFWDNFEPGNEEAAEEIYKKWKSS